MDIGTMIGLLFVVVVNVAGTAYLAGQFKARLNGTQERVTKVENTCGDLHGRITGHVEEFHTKERN